MLATKAYQQKVCATAWGQIDDWFYKNKVFLFTLKFYSSSGDWEQRFPSFFCGTRYYTTVLLLLFSLNRSNKLLISSLILLSTTLAYIWVVDSLVCPKSLDTVSMGTPLESITVVAKVCLATWKEIFLWIPQDLAISFK